MTILPSSLFKSTVSPGATLLLLVPLAVKFQPLLATFATSFNCETFTASVSASPAATPVILLLPALIPFLVTLGPPAIVKPSLLMVVSPAFKPSFVKATSLPTFTPSLFKTVSPAFTLSTLMSFANFTIRKFSCISYTTNYFNGFT